MIHPRTRDVFSFLWNHLEKDLVVLGKTLGQNMDNTAVTVHLILNTCTTGDTDSPALLLLFTWQTWLDSAECSQRRRSSKSGSVLQTSTASVGEARVWFCHQPSASSEEYHCNWNQYMWCIYEDDMMKSFFLLPVFRICRENSLKLRTESLQMMDSQEVPWWLFSSGTLGKCCPSLLTVRHIAPLSGLFLRQWRWSASLSWWENRSDAALYLCW